MDILQIIKEKIKKFPESYNNAGIDAVILHIERAERYWERAKEEGDEFLFTDVIYRTNQAFEGILKEAYSLLAGKNAAKSRPYDIEKYFDESKIFKERVLAAFTNYRTEWRNTSTHDYKLFFTEQEALLAITSVSTFCVILLDQISLKINELFEQERAVKFSSQVISSINNYEKLPLANKVASLLIKSYQHLLIPKDREIREYEYLGLLSGFIKAVDPELILETDIILDKSSRSRADLVVSKDKDKILVELKRAGLWGKYGSDATSQLTRYLSLSGIKQGIIMLIDQNAKDGEVFTQSSLFDEDSFIMYVKPKEKD